MPSTCIVPVLGMINIPSREHIHPVAQISIIGIMHILQTRKQMLRDRNLPKATQLELGWLRARLLDFTALSLKGHLKYTLTLSRTWFYIDLDICSLLAFHGGC